ncbi:MULTISPECIES: homocysteine S-methyltransferase family protein [unclassified Modicisalibacter]|uniref:homocysteine S-methyltransferase family protein n=1 Tax=unclassified Modicisalibacter TaxID=2679913 RepID=UPI001CCBADC5|nr:MULTISPECIES: homocysteine S-methyltransferase family protein [unclassified Modicisalibacter]MBZ9557861.1 homocysteine S-methyltransferase family protein [Modicisalibacter sp. R2A 31.J]MBZ9573473.1 homocysteine S-methyltransferase family protein [Modicisalibacter sp. MOD 31.J]
MTRYRNALPQSGDRLFLTDGGLETTLIYHEGFDLPDFAAFVLLDDPAGERALNDYYRAYIDVARRYGTGLILESATWRASPDWGRRQGYDGEALAALNRRAIALLESLRDDAAEGVDLVVSGCLGPRGDGYSPERLMSVAEARAYHRRQAEALTEAGADMLSAITLNYPDEATGIAQLARELDMPVALSFTVETDGRLPTGETLREAIERVDADSDAYPAYYMINCAHPSHFTAAFDDGEGGLARLKGLRANASRKSHAELDAATELDSGDPQALGADYATLRARLPQFTILGGCCGTDQRHIASIAEACSPVPRLAS